MCGCVVHVIAEWGGGGGGGCWRLGLGALLHFLSFHKLFVIVVEAPAAFSETV